MPQPGFNQRPQNYGCATCTQISRDDGGHFEKYIFEEGKDDPFLEAGAVELADGRFFFMDTYVTADPSEPKEHAAGEAGYAVLPLIIRTDTAGIEKFPYKMRIAAAIYVRYY